MRLFTKEERFIILLALTLLFSGMVISYYKKTGRELPFQEERKWTVDLYRDIDAGPVDINKADEHELVKLPYIGPVLARRITSYRKIYGPFRKKEDIKKIKGIGDRVYKKLEKYIEI